MAHDHTSSPAFVVCRRTKAAATAAAAVAAAATAENAFFRLN